MSSFYDKSSLVLIPSGTKTSKVFSQKPTNGDGDFDFTRSTAATRVNADGNIEKETQNLLTYSNDFSQSDWAKYLISLTSGQSGYDGTSDAWLLERSGAFGNVYRNLSISGVHTWSVYAKAGSYDFLCLRYRNTSNQYRSAFFDLSSGTLGSVDSNIIKHTIEDVGGGWYRCQIAFNDSAANQVMIYPSDVNNGIGNSGTGNILIQDAQLEQGLVARDYIETTTTALYGGITDNVPRLDYTDSSCPALLLEPQRTNLLSFSEYFSSFGGTATINANAAISPEGVQNATEVILSGASNFYTEVPVTAGQDYTFSFYVKQGTNTNNQLAIRDQTNGVFIDIDVSYTASPTEWKRVEHTFTAPVGCIEARVYPHRSSSAADGNGYFYGAQLEEGSYATSYIPTYGTSVTRNVDTTYIQDGMTSLNSVDSMTIYFEVDFEDFITYAQRYSVLTNFSGSNNWIFLSYESSGSVRGYIRANSSVSWDYQWSSGFPTSGTIKAALVIPADGNAKLYGNGLLRVENSGAVLTTGFDTIALGGTNGAAGNKQRLKQFLVFPTALTDQEAIDLTTI